MKDYKSVTDKDLIALMKLDDANALSELYNRYWDKLLSVCINRLNDLELAQEIVQDIFVKLWERRCEIEISYALNTYLAVAAKYSVIDQLDKRYRRGSAVQIDDDYSHLVVPAADERIMEDELSRHIEMTIKALPEKCQLIFRMSREDQMTYKQIAAKLQISEKTVEAHISKALREIKTNLNVCLPLLLVALWSNKGF